MSNPRALLTAIFLGGACWPIPASAALAAPDANHKPTALAEAIATDAHIGAARHRSKHARSRHAHTSCQVSRKHHRKHRQRCHKPNRARLRTRSRLHAKGVGHTAKPSTIVTISLPPPAATIASVLATPCQNTELMPEPGNLEAVREATVCLINQERARNNELPLQPNAQLGQVAQQHSEDMIGKDYFAHTTPSGETQQDRVLASGYIPNAQVGYTIGENIAWGTLYLATPSSIVAAWIASPEHLANILNPEYRETGVGVDPAAPPSLAEGQPGAIYTQEFGVIQG